MKVLLTAVNAKYIHSNPAVYSLRAYAGKYLKEAAEIVIREYTINNRVDDILEGIYKAAPDVLCFSCYIWNISYVEQLISEYHKLCPEVPIWVGGPEVSYEVEAFLKKHPEVTGIMIGEGEKTFLELCEYYAYRKKEGTAGIYGLERAAKRELTDIHGIAYHIRKLNAGGEHVSPGTYDDAGLKLIVTEPQEILDLSTIPFCYEDTEDFKNRIIYYESSRGCPFHCSYCLSSVERALRFRNLGLVKKELTFFLEREVPQVKFVDRTFNCNREHAAEIWRFILEHDNGITNFHFEISADLLSEGELELLGAMRPGLIQLEIGVQSTHPATIMEIHRTMRLKRLKEVVRAIQGGRNIHQHLDLIAGLPEEDYRTFAKSFDEIYALKPEQLQLGFLKVLKGSYMYTHAEEYGLLFHDRPPYEVMRTKWLDYSDILRIRQVEEMLEVYYNSGQFTKTMEILETQFASPFYMYQSMGEFYERSGYFGMSHTRIRRSEILLEFAEDAAKVAVPVLRESLIFDLYLRENMKSRPSWAADPREWKDLMRQYCQNGKQVHIERFSYHLLNGIGGRQMAESLPGADGIRVSGRLPEQDVQYVLFNYRKRDPFHHQAFACVLEEKITERRNIKHDEENQRNTEPAR